MTVRTRTTIMNQDENMKDGKYEEALERARQGLPIDEIFPELKESEDERIREGLIQHLKELRSWKVGTGAPIKVAAHYDAWIAYLERQKDEIELGFIEGKVEGVRQTCQEIKDAMSLFEPKDLTPFEFTFRDYIDSAIRYCLSGEGYQQYIKEWAADLLNLEKHKEQKPAEWSEEDETMLERCISKMANIIPVPGKHGLEDMSFEKHTDEELVIWLNSLPKRFELQPKQEVVDRTVFDRIADILRWCDLPIGCPVENFKESESEREHLLNIVQCAAHRYANSCTYCKEYSRGYQDGLAVHHWKPSEEQMNHLRYAYTQLKLQKCYAPHVYETLGSLYDDLEKL